MLAIAERDLAGRLADLQHAHHSVVIASTHVHLDPERCPETVMLRGPTAQGQTSFDAVCAQRGVRHGALGLVSAQVRTAEQAHGHVHAHGHPQIAPHVHVTPSFELRAAAQAVHGQPCILITAVRGETSASGEQRVILGWRV